jgi:hypothetical protein
MAAADSLVATFPLRLIAGLLTFTQRLCGDRLRRAARQSSGGARNVNEAPRDTIDRSINGCISSLFAKG